MDWRAFAARLRAAVAGDPEATAIVHAADGYTGLSRRGFLRFALGAAAVAATVDVEQLLWMPGEKTIVLPEFAPGGSWIVTAEWMAREAVRVMERQLAFMKHVNCHYDAANKVLALSSKTQHFGVDMDFSQIPARMTERHARRAYAEPVGRQLACRVAEHGIARFADLELPKGVDEARLVRTRSGLSARGLKHVWVDPLNGMVHHTMRIDVAGEA